MGDQKGPWPRRPQKKVTEATVATPLGGASARIWKKKALSTAFRPMWMCIQEAKRVITLCDKAIEIFQEGSEEFSRAGMSVSHASGLFAAEREPDLATLVSLGKQTEADMQRRPVAWEGVFTTPKVTFVIHILRHGERIIGGGGQVVDGGYGDFEDLNW